MSECSTRQGRKKRDMVKKHDTDENKMEDGIYKRKKEIKDWGRTRTKNRDNNKEKPVKNEVEDKHKNKMAEWAGVYLSWIEAI